MCDSSDKGFTYVISWDSSQINLARERSSKLKTNYNPVLQTTKFIPGVHLVTSQNGVNIVLSVVLLCIFKRPWSIALFIRQRRNRDGSKQWHNVIKDKSWLRTVSRSYDTFWRFYLSLIFIIFSYRGIKRHSNSFMFICVH